MYQNIMVPLDGSELAEDVLPHVETLTSGGNVGKVTLVRVVVPLHFYGGMESRISPEERQRLEASDMDIAKNYLEQVVKRLTDVGIAAQSEVLYGKVIDKLADYADKEKIDLIVIATHGRSGASLSIWGSIANQILRSSGVPVLMVRTHKHTGAI